MSQASLEKELELEILNYLKIKGVFSWKAEYPIKINQRTNRGMRNHHPFILKGVPDILALYQGIFYGIEVKTVKELAWWDKAKERILKQGPKNKKDERFLRQYVFINTLKSNGAWGGFVSSREECFKILKEGQANCGSGASKTL